LTLCTREPTSSRHLPSIRRTGKEVSRSFGEAARAHNEAARERAELSTNLHALCTEVREVVSLLGRSTQVIEALPTLVAQQVSEALARGASGSIDRELH
jgi:hypothetical protein